jgi:hypothetical protein
MPEDKALSLPALFLPGATTVVVAALATAEEEVIPAALNAFSSSFSAARPLLRDRFLEEVSSSTDAMSSLLLAVVTLPLPLLFLLVLLLLLLLLLFCGSFLGW